MSDQVQLLFWELHPRSGLLVRFEVPYGLHVEMPTVLRCWGMEMGEVPLLRSIKRLPARAGCALPMVGLFFSLARTYALPVA